jgi:hypothetical protein
VHVQGLFIQAENLVRRQENILSLLSSNTN